MSLWPIALHPVVLIGFGSAVGGVCRFYLGRWIDANWRHADGIPWGTFTINVSGSFALGLIALVILERLPLDYRPLYFLAGTGFCGGFTTFSTFEWETLQLLRAGHWGVAGLYVAGSVLAGLLGIFLAFLIGHHLMGKP